MDITSIPSPKFNKNYTVGRLSSRSFQGYLIYLVSPRSEFSHYFSSDSDIYHKKTLSSFLHIL